MLIRDVLISLYSDCYWCCLRLRLILIYGILGILLMYSRRLFVELLLTVFTLQRCSDNFEYLLEKDNLGIMTITPVMTKRSSYFLMLYRHSTNK